MLGTVLTKGINKGGVGEVESGEVESGEVESSELETAGRVRGGGTIS